MSSHADTCRRLLKKAEKDNLQVEHIPWTISEKRQQLRGDLEKESGKLSELKEDYETTHPFDAAFWSGKARKKEERR